jgi:hypothetical protein
MIFSTFRAEIVKDLIEDWPVAAGARIERVQSFRFRWNQAFKRELADMIF